MLIDFSLTVKAATLIFISGRGSTISSAWEEKSGSIYNLVKSYNKLFRPRKRNQCGPRSDCSCRSSLIWVHNVRLYAYVK